MNNTNVTKLLGRLLESNSETIKIGCDIHARELAVSIQVDDARALRPQLMMRQQLLVLVRGLVEAKRKVHVCYETGPCGYGLYFDLQRAGAQAYVIVAEVLGDGRKQKTDKLDAAALCDKLDRYLAGQLEGDGLGPSADPGRTAAAQRVPAAGAVEAQPSSVGGARSQFAALLRSPRHGQVVGQVVLGVVAAHAAGVVERAISGDPRD